MPTASSKPFLYGEGLRPQPERLVYHETIGGYPCRSRGGVPAALRALALTHPPRAGLRLLDVGSDAGVNAVYHAVRWGIPPACASADLLLIDQYRTQLHLNEISAEPLPLVELSEAGGGYGCVLLGGVWDREEYLEYLAAAAAVLIPGGEARALVPAGRRLDDYLAAAREAFTSATVTPACDGSAVITATEPRPGVDWRRYNPLRTVRANLGGELWEFQTQGGVFSPDKVEGGARAILDCFAADNTGTVVDVGCGYGVLGFVLARRLPSARIIMTDTNLRAIRLAQMNQTRLGIENVEIHYADCLAPVTAPVSHIVCNPPYHSDYHFASVLIKTAFTKLSPGGRIWLVMKRDTWYRNRLEAVFGGVKRTVIGEYTVLYAVKRAAGLSKPTPKQPSRKQQRRDARVQSSRRKSRR